MNRSVSTASLRGSEASFRDRLSSGRPLIGSFVFSPDAAHTEILGLSGFDFAVIDTEHAPLGALEVTAHARAAALSGVAPIARVRGDDPADVGRLLDTGVEGIMLPHVGLNPARTRDAISATRYAPSGARPTCTGVRSVDFGLADFGVRSELSNAEVVTIGLVEDAVAVERIDQLLSEVDLDVVIPGAGDLSTSLGLPGQLSHPNVLAAVERVVTATVAAGARPGVYVRNAEEAAIWSERGVDIFLASIDYRVLALAYQVFGTELRNTITAEGQN